MTRTDSLVARLMAPVGPRLRHAENPDRLGWGLCGRKLRGNPKTADGQGQRCVVCEDLTKPRWTER